MSASDTKNIVILRQQHGTSASSCGNCTKASVCPAYATGAALRSFAGGAPMHRNFRAGQSVLEAGDAFTGVYMVKSGFFKSSFLDSDGILQVTSFHFPGEMFGFDGLDGNRHGTLVEALDTGSVCKIPLALAPGRAGTLWNTDTLVSLLQVASEAIARDRTMMYALGKLCARRRFATFLLDISRRMGDSGFDPDAFRLCMSRNDIANNLSLAVETVSRLFTQFQVRGIVRVERRDLKILDRQALTAAAEADADAGMLFEQAS